MPIGVVRYWSKNRGFGFIRETASHGERDMFFHFSQVQDDLPAEVLGARVGYDIGKSRAASAKTGDPSRANMAINIRFIE